MGQITEIDKMKWAETRLMYEAGIVQEAIDRLEGIRLPSVVQVRQGYLYQQNRIGELLMSIRRKLEMEGERW